MRDPNPLASPFAHTPGGHHFCALGIFLRNSPRRGIAPRDRLRSRLGRSRQRGASQTAGKKSAQTDEPGGASPVRELGVRRLHPLGRRHGLPAQSAALGDDRRGSSADRGMQNPSRLHRHGGVRRERLRALRRRLGTDAAPAPFPEQHPDGQHRLGPDVQSGSQHGGGSAEDGHRRHDSRRQVRRHPRPRRPLHLHHAQRHPAPQRGPRPARRFDGSVSLRDHRRRPSHQNLYARPAGRLHRRHQHQDERRARQTGAESQRLHGVRHERHRQRALQILPGRRQRLHGHAYGLAEFHEQRSG